MANPHPVSKFQKGHKLAGRKPGQPNLVSRDLKTLIREAAAEAGFVERVPVCDAEGRPTGRTELKFGKDGEAGYLKWLAANHPAVFGALYGKLIPLDVNAKVEEKKVVRYEFGALYGKLIPLDVNAKVEEKKVVRYETVEERRAAMIAKGWSPTVLAAMKEAMEPKFLRDMREENEGPGEAN